MTRSQHTKCRLLDAVTVVKAQGANPLGQGMPIIQMRESMHRESPSLRMGAWIRLASISKPGGHAINNRMAVPTEASDGYWQLQT